MSHQCCRRDDRLCGSDDDDDLRPADEIRAEATTDLPSDVLQLGQSADLGSDLAATVTQVVHPFVADDRASPDEGREWLKVFVRVENAGDEEAMVDFNVICVSGDAHRYFYETEDAIDPLEPLPANSFDEGAILFGLSPGCPPAAVTAQAVGVLEARCPASCLDDRAVMAPASKSALLAALSLLLAVACGDKGQEPEVSPPSAITEPVDEDLAESLAVNHLAEQFTLRGHVSFAPECETYRQDDAWLVECWESGTEYAYALRVTGGGDVELLAPEVPPPQLPFPDPPSAPPIA